MHTTNTHSNLRRPDALWRHPNLRWSNRLHRHYLRRSDPLRGHSKLVDRPAPPPAARKHTAAAFTPVDRPAPQPAARKHTAAAVHTCGPITCGGATLCGGVSYLWSDYLWPVPRSAAAFKLVVRLPCGPQTHCGGVHTCGPTCAPTCGPQTHCGGVHTCGPTCAPTCGPITCGGPTHCGGIHTCVAQATVCGPLITCGGRRPRLAGGVHTCGPITCGPCVVNFRPKNPAQCPVHTGINCPPVTIGGVTSNR
jgi:hypothetical protein